ncbi:MAG: porin [Deltaproteobacteria bacterium]|nr:porin [Deltaproteobacteria bacterium]
MAAVLLFAWAGGAAAQTLQQRVETLEKKIGEGRGSVAEALGVEFHGFVAGNYSYNFNSPDSKANRLHVFDEDANTFALDQANLNIQRNKPEGLGFLVDLDFGKTAEVVGRFTRWSNGSSSESSNSFELRQAYLKYSIANTPFSLQAGKFVTFHGAEIIKAYNNQNYNISSGILFGNSIPFTHTGLVGTYTLPNELGSISAGVVNGWDNVVDNNDGKSAHAMLTLTPHPMVSFALSGTYGAEQSDSGRSKRLMVTPLVTIKPVEQLTLIIDYNYGNESDIALDSTPAPTGFKSVVPAAGSSMWQGIAGYVVVAATDELQVAVRGEIFDDPDGVRTGFQEDGFGPGATFWEVTPAVAYKITDGLTLRAEYRHDESDKRFFDKEERNIANGDSGLRGQDTVATELIYAF